MAGTAGHAGPTCCARSPPGTWRPWCCLTCPDGSRTPPPFGRVSNHHGTTYLRSRYPLLDLGWSRQDCERWLTSKGWTVAKSACIGCPFHGNRQWRELRDHHPQEWGDAVAFDHALRERSFVGPTQVPFLHRSLLPLDEAPIDVVTAAELRERQLSLADVELAENGAADGCSPYGCRSGDSAD